MPVPPNRYLRFVLQLHVNMDEMHPTLRARVSHTHRLTRLFSTESEYERKLRHVGRPFLGISTEKNVENASTVETHPNFAGLFRGIVLRVKKTWRRFMALREGTPTSGM